jgi:hypothetical protein
LLPVFNVLRCWARDRVLIATALHCELQVRAGGSFTGSGVLKIMASIANPNGDIQTVDWL